MAISTYSSNYRSAKRIKSDRRGYIDYAPVRFEWKNCVAEIGKENSAAGPSTMPNPAQITLLLETLSTPTRLIVGGDGPLSWRGNTP